MYTNANGCCGDCAEHGVKPCVGMSPFCTPLARAEGQLARVLRELDELARRCCDAVTDREKCATIESLKSAASSEATLMRIVVSDHLHAAERVLS